MSTERSARPSRQRTVPGIPVQRPIPARWAQFSPSDALKDDETGTLAVPDDLALVLAVEDARDATVLADDDVQVLVGDREAFLCL